MMYQRFTYTDDASSAVDFTLETPGRQWLPGARGIGGIEFSASGVPSAWEQRVDYTLRQTLRVTEEEWPAVEKMLEHARRGTEITVYADSEDAGTSRACYAAPGWAERLWSEGIMPQPGEFTGELTIDCEWRSTTTTWAGTEFYG